MLRFGLLPWSSLESCSITLPHHTHRAKEHDDTSTMWLSKPSHSTVQPTAFSIYCHDQYPRETKKMLPPLPCPKSSKQKHNCECWGLGWCWHRKWTSLQMSSKRTVNHLVKSILSDRLNAREKSIISKKCLAFFFFLSMFRLIVLEVLTNQLSSYMSK